MYDVAIIGAGVVGGMIARTLSAYDLKIFILEKEELKNLEPNLSDEVLCALYATTGAIVCPYEFTCAAVGNAMDNGAELKTEFEVMEVKEIAEGYEIFSSTASINAKFIVNAAGLFSDSIANMVGDYSFKIMPRRGGYMRCRCNIYRKKEFWGVLDE